MLDRVDKRTAAKFSSIGNLYVVSEGILIAVPASANGRAGAGRQKRAARPAVLIENGGEFPAADFGDRSGETARENYLRDIGIAFEHGGTPRLDENSELQIGPPSMESREGGSFENDVAERAETKNQNFSAGREMGKK